MIMCDGVALATYSLDMLELNFNNLLLRSEHVRTVMILPVPMAQISVNTLQ